MKPNFLILLFQLFFISLFGQFEDNFSNDLSNWQGDLDSFIINSDAQLQLNANVTGNSTLYTQTNIPDSTIWELYFRMNFAPSDNNELRIFLQADDEDLLNSDGYFLEIGESGSDDAIHFYRSDGGNKNLLASASLGAVGSSPAEAKFRMERTANGIWTFFADYEGGNNLSTEFTVEDTNYGGDENLYYGFYCKYTSSNVERFFFDDVKVLPLVPDTQPPVLISATPISNTQIDVLFSEKLDLTSAEIISNYNLDNGIGMPTSAVLDNSNLSLVHLTFANPMTNLTEYILTTNNIADEIGNISVNQEASFFFLIPEEAKALDIIINELIADPTPTIGLPNVEWIELYNRSDKVIDLEDFGFSNGSSPKSLPSYLLFPDSYVIVCDEDAADSLSQFGDLVLLPTFPALSNGGDDLSLTNPFGDLIHFVNYTLDWYGDLNKLNGGYSLEMISPLNICEGQTNWRATQNPVGGTPNQQNSIFESLVDEQKPELAKVFVSRQNSSQVQLTFNEILDLTAAENIENYSINNNVSIIDATLDFPAQRQVFLELASPLEIQIDYEITIKTELTDCNGNAIGIENSAIFSVPEIIEKDDILINEILFNPQPGGFDFLELFNNSNKTVDLGELLIKNIRQVTPDSTTEVVNAVQSNFLFRPKTYAVITESPSDILNRYFVENPKQLINNDLPSFNDDEGRVVIFTTDFLDAITIDSFDYDENLHHILLDDEEGVSLERINQNTPTQNNGNWHSGAESAGFATPTYQNSQITPEQNSGDEVFTLVNRTFSPDNDGYKDFTQVNYNLSENGFVANVKVFDANGRFVQHLARNEILSQEGTFKWDGATENGDRARIGIYIIWIQIFSPDGKVEEIKKTCVVGGEF